MSLAASATAAALLLTACSSGSATEDEATPTPSASASMSSDAASPSSDATSSDTASSDPGPSDSVQVPEGQELTEQGSQLSFGQPATVVVEPETGEGSVLRMTVNSVRKGRLADLDGFILDDAYTRKASYYYAKVTVTNVGTGDLGGAAVPLFGLNAKNTMLPAVTFTTEFSRCPTRKLPETFGTGQSMDTCLVYLSPDRGKLTAVTFRPDKDFNPISWDGVVKPPAPAKKAEARGGAGG